MRTFLHLLALVAPHWKSMLLATLLGFLTVGSGVGLLATSAYLISAAALHPPVLDLMQPVVGVRFFGISRAVFRYLERYISHDTAFRIISSIRVRFYSALEPLAPAGLAEYRSGDLVSRIVSDVGTLEQFYLRVLAPPLVALMVLVGSIIFLSLFGFYLALALLLFFLAAAVAVPFGIGALGRGVGARAVKERSHLKAGLVDAIQGMTEILVFDRSGRTRDLLRDTSRKLSFLQGRAAYLGSLANALTALLMNLAMWAVLVLSIPLVAMGQLKGVHLAVVSLAVLGSFEAVLSLPMVSHHLEESLAAARRLFAVTGARPALEEPPGRSPAPGHCGLVVSSLRFSYGQEDPPAIDGLDFELPAGRRLAIVGPSGAGKSTLLNLLLRFYDYSQGTISIGGYDLKDYSPEDVRRLMSVVTQHTYLFNATIRENLLLANPGAGTSDIVRAAEEASIHRFIISLPNGYDTYVGERGQKLSGGQRQRLAIARAILKNAPILLLDEATAGLDPVTEQEVMESVRRLMEGRTTLVITHRLAGLEFMDEILVLDRGRVVERGRHHDLIRRGGHYRNMFELQHRF